MVLAAGLGTRMRPLTDDRPKAMVEVGGRALIDHVLDRLAGAGVEMAVVNVHWFADRLEAHLAGRAVPRILISDEREALLETGGGLKKARPLLGDDPVFVANIDSVWTDGGQEGCWLSHERRLRLREVCFFEEVFLCTSQI
jgi:MurNAc alpha-1-phosphate uridylyltransferase